MRVVLVLLGMPDRQIPVFIESLAFGILAL